MRTLYFLVIFLIPFNQSIACECKTYPIINGKTQNELFLEDSFENATIIFYGKYIGDGIFKHIKIYRGKEITLNRKLIEEKGESNNCDYFFKKNIKYIVFGKLDESGKLWTSVCYANAQIDDKKQLKFVKKYLKK